MQNTLNAKLQLRLARLAYLGPRFLKTSVRRKAY